MSRKRTEAVGGQNETSDVESSGGYSGWLLTSLHSAPHEALVLRGEHQVPQREDAVRASRRAESLPSDKRCWLVEASSKRRQCQDSFHRNYTVENDGRM